MENRNLENLINEVQSKRSIIINYNEFLNLSEFLIMHESEFKITSINNDLDELTLRLL